jgi:hypothetical protein
MASTGGQPMTGGDWMALRGGVRGGSDVFSADNIAYRRVICWLICVVNGNPIVTPWQSEKMWKLDQWLRKQIEPDNVARSHQLRHDA